MADQDRYPPDRSRGGGRDVYMDNRTGIGAPGRGYRAQWKEEGRHGDREETYNQRRGENASFREDDYGQSDGGRTGYRAQDDESRYGGGYKADWGRGAGRHESYGGGRYGQGRSRYAAGDDQSREHEHQGWLDYAARSNSDFYADQYGAAGPGWAENYRDQNRDRGLESYRGQRSRGQGGEVGYNRGSDRFGLGYTGNRSAQSFEADYGEHHRGEGRGFWDKAADKMAEWFGGEESRGEGYEARHRGEHRGKGPKGYARSDDRIREDVCDRLTDDSWLDASDIEVKVERCDVTLTGQVKTREDKRRAEQLAEMVGGVDNVQNNLRVERQDQGRTTTNVPVTNASSAGSTAIPASGGTSSVGDLGTSNAAKKTTQ